jgi:phosphoribosyl-dephospho-CoA transferase
LNFPPNRAILKVEKRKTKEEKIMKKTILSLILVLILFGCLNIFAQSETLPPEGITPDSLFYFFDTLQEKIGLFFAFSPEGKAKKAFIYSKEKLAEARLMAFKNKVADFKEAFGHYLDYLTLGSQQLIEAKNQGKDIEQVTDLMAEIMVIHFPIISESLESIQEKLTDKETEDLFNKLSKSMESLDKDEELSKKIGDKATALENKQAEKNKGKLSKIEKSISLGTFSFSDYGYDMVTADGTWISDTELAYPVQASHIICMKDFMLCTEAFGQISEDGYLFVSNELYDIQTWNDREIVTKPSDFGCTRYIMRFDRMQKQVTQTRTTISTEGICQGMQKEPIHLYLGDGFKVLEKLQKK